MAVSACPVLRGTCSVDQIMRQPLPMGQSCGVCVLPCDVLESAFIVLEVSQLE